MSFKAKKQPNPVKYQSANLETANHLNAIALRNLSLSLDRLHKDKEARFKRDLRHLRSISQDLDQLPVTTGNTNSRMFESTKFGKLMVPIKRERLPDRQEKNS